MSEEETPIDWESPFDDIRSSEVDSIALHFNTNGVKLLKEDEKGDIYTQFKFQCTRTDITNPKEVIYITSSKRLIESIANYAPIEGKDLQIEKSGSGFQTRYTVTEL